MQSDFSTWLAVDAKTVTQLRLTFPTWVTWHPEILTRQIHVICDEHAGDRRHWAHYLGFMAPYCRPTIHLWDWPHADYKTDIFDPEITQRERMLTAFVRLMHQVETPYVLKLDTDVVATAPGTGWIPDFRNQPATIYAPRWGYTKPAGYISMMDDWAEKIPLLNPVPFKYHRFDQLPGTSLSQRAGIWRFHLPRVCSWLAFYERDFCKLCSGLVPEDRRLPVASEDTYRWYVAKRLGLHIVTTSPRSHGWQVRHTENGIRGLIEETTRTQ